MDTKSLAVSGDWQIIERLGGPTKVARLLGYAQSGGVQRVQNWKARGIPPAVKVDFPHLFLPQAGAAQAAIPAEEAGA
ncbi:hypothetical protein [Cupriavidus basilensis]|uniref:hypothetical protein n=1 Tax=Cupriavidus basilensis TaxID=68895 RepID=UPI00157B7DA2|nr:hypothetical protein [Cupriavidus basilensis]NUA26129.1 hypothetical protein [Cupriavidus basilensis]